MLDVFILSVLVGADISLTLYFRYEDSKRPTPLTSLEWHMTKDNGIEAIIDILNESDKKRRIERWEEFQRLRKDLNGRSDSNGKPKSDGDGE